MPSASTRSVSDHTILSSRGAAASRTGRLVPVSAALLLASCAHYDAQDLDLQTGAAGFVRQRGLDELYVAVDDLSSPRTSVKYFDRDLVEFGYVPVLVTLLLDETSDSTFDLSRQDMRLVLKSGERLESAEPGDIASRVAFSHWRSAFGYLFLLPGPFVAASVSHANQELEGDYRHKGLDSIRINSHLRSHRGIVFFTIREDLRDSFEMEDAFVEVKIYKQGKGDQLGRVFDLPLHFR